MGDAKKRMLAPGDANAILLPLPHFLGKENKMNFAVDWATKKEYQIYNMDEEKLTSIPATQQAFQEFFEKLGDTKSSFFIEEGGGDTFKLMALKGEHRVFTIIGKKVKEYREKLGLLKTDETDAKVIGELAKIFGVGDATKNVLPTGMLPQSCSPSSLFYEFKESDMLTLKISILHREYCKLDTEIIQHKNQLFALKKKLALVASIKEVKKIISKREEAIKLQEQEKASIKALLIKLIKNHPVQEYFKTVKGVGPVVAAGIIGSIGRFARFPSKYSLRHFAGMITKKGQTSYNRPLKKALYYFIEEIIKNRTPLWRDMYDSRKKDYAAKHPDWSAGKVNGFTMKFVQTKFLDEVYKYMKKVDFEGGDATGVMLASAMLY
jgi:transposase